MAQDITWSGAVLTESDINAKLMHESTAWTSYTPTLVQSGSVTKNISYAAWAKLGPTIIGNVQLNVTGTGTAANNVVVGLPTAAATSAARQIGSGYIYDTSAALVYGGFLVITTTTTAILYRDGSNQIGLGQAGFGAALAVNDVVTYTFMYESA